MTAESQSQSVGGWIAHFGLEQWWFAEFSEDERLELEAAHTECAGNLEGSIEISIDENATESAPDATLTTGQVADTERSVVHFLAELADIFGFGEARPIGLRVLRKAEALVTPETDVLDVDLLLRRKIEILYRGRSDPLEYQQALEACRQHIAIAPTIAQALRNRAHRRLAIPRHTGYEQLVIALEKEREFAEAIALCEQAQQEGWYGDWQKRIDRCRRKARVASAQRTPTHG